MKRPSFQFYPGDWLNDAALRMCSVGARGLWIDMLAFMHQGSDYGYLKVNHKSILPVNLARMVGATLSDCEGYLSELEEAGCFSRDEQGAIYSRRMIRDEDVRQKRAAGGHLGGNPALKGKAKKPIAASKEDGNKVNHTGNLQPTPSSSSSSSSSSSIPDGIEITRDAPKKVQRPDDVDPVLWDEWRSHRRAKRAATTEGVINSLRLEAGMLSWTLSQALRKQIDRGWTGFEADWVRSDMARSAAPSARTSGLSPAGARAVQSASAWLSESGINTEKIVETAT